MKSTDHNINNPLCIGGIDLMKTAEAWTTPTVELISQQMYDMLQVKDPLRIYMIHDAKDKRIYLGEILIENSPTGTKYFIGVDKRTREYVLYMNVVQDYGDRLVPLSRYRDPQMAFDALNMYSNAGSHQTLEVSLFSIICAFLDKLIPIHDLIIGSMCLFGFKSDPRLQMLTDVAISYGVKSMDDDLPPLLREELPILSLRYDNQLFDVYLKLFNVLVKYNMFRSKEYRKPFDELDLEAPIKEIISVMKLFTPLNIG